MSSYRASGYEVQVWGMRGWAYHSQCVTKVGARIKARRLNRRSRR